MYSMNKSGPRIGSLRYTEGGGFATRERTIYKTFLSRGEKIGFKSLIGRARNTIGFQFRRKNGVVNGVKCFFRSRNTTAFTFPLSILNAQLSVAWSKAVTMDGYQIILS